MPGIVLKQNPRRNRELETMPDIQLLSSPGIAVQRTASLPLAYAGRPSIPETFETDREAAAYWIARSSRAMTVVDEAAAYQPLSSQADF
jgi:hypothetical protein